jgi:neopullulanase
LTAIATGKILWSKNYSLWFDYDIMKKHLIFLILVIGMDFHANAQISRIEPPNWWAGMNCPDLQIMIYGDNVSRSEISIKYPGIKIKSITSPASPNYIFIDLVLSKNVSPGVFIIKLTKGKEVKLINYELKARETGSASRKGFNNSDVIYLIVPDRFSNGNPSNDTMAGMLEGINRNHKTGRHGGDLKGISDHTDYIKEMGFTALWPTPVLENNQKRASYHGYAITDFYNVDPRMGTNEEYAALSRKLTDNGIKLIMDMVFNHCGSEHWWMKDLPFPDWINNYPDVKLTNNRRTVNEDPYASESDKKGMSDGWFVHSMPDLNQKNPFMAKYLIQNSIWWIEFANLSGIRMDTYPYPDKYMMSDWTKRVLEEYPDFNMVGEEWCDNPAIVSYWQRGQNNRDGFKSYLPSLMDFPIQSALIKALTEPEGWATGWVRLYETTALDFLYPDPFNLVVIPDNHDMARFFMQLDKDTALYKLGISYLLTTRGIPQIFYGSEILMTHPKSNDHGDIRKDFPGGWANDSTNAFTGEGLRKEQILMQEYFKTLINWRKDNESIHTGKLMHFAPEDGCFVYFRYNNKKTVMVVLNKNISSTNLPLERFSERLQNFASGQDVITGVNYTLSGEISVPAKTALILELK